MSTPLALPTKVSVPTPLQVIVVPPDVIVCVGSDKLIFKTSPSASVAIVPVYTVKSVVSSPAFSPVESTIPSRSPSSETLAYSSVTTGE